MLEWVLLRSCHSLHFIHNTRYVFIHLSINIHKKVYFWLRFRCKLKKKTWYGEYIGILHECASKSVSVIQTLNMYVRMKCIECDYTSIKQTHSIQQLLLYFCLTMSYNLNAYCINSTIPAPFIGWIRYDLSIHVQRARALKSSITCTTSTCVIIKHHVYNEQVRYNQAPRVQWARAL